MKLVANYHTHVSLCGHAEGMSEDYVKKALEVGFEEIGISDHCFVPLDFMSKEDYYRFWLERQMTEQSYYQEYLPDLEKTIKKYGDKIKIYRAVELEYIPGHEEHYRKRLEELDYLNLGVHFFKYKDKFYNVYDSIDATNLEGYVHAAVEGMKTKMFKILVHPDLFMFDYHSEDGYLVFDRRCEEASRRIIEAAIENDVYIEVNCGGINKGLRNTNGVMEYSYPRSEFWKLVKEYPDVKVVIGCDAHKPKALDDEAVQIAIKMLKDLGIKYYDKITF